MSVDSRSGQISKLCQGVWHYWVLRLSRLHRAARWDRCWLAHLTTEQQTVTQPRSQWRSRHSRTDRGTNERGIFRCAPARARTRLKSCTHRRELQLYRIVYVLYHFGGAHGCMQAHQKAAELRTSASLQKHSYGIVPYWVLQIRV